MNFVLLTQDDGAILGPVSKLLGFLMEGIFNVLDLIGIPIRIVVGEKNLPNVEVKMRNQTEANLVPLEEASSKVVQIVQEELAKLNA